MSPGCSSSLLLFESREEWIAHELENHYQEWWCDFPHEGLRSVLIFASPIDFATHLQTTHPTSISRDNISFFISRAQRPSLDPFTRCPFYDDRKLERRPDVVTSEFIEASKALQKHIGVHLQNVASLAFLEDDEEEESQLNKSNAQGSAEGRATLLDLESIELDFDEEGRDTCEDGGNSDGHLGSSSVDITNTTQQRPFAPTLPPHQERRVDTYQSPPPPPPEPDSPDIPTSNPAMFLQNVTDEGSTAVTDMSERLSHPSQKPIQRREISDPLAKMFIPYQEAIINTPEQREGITNSEIWE